jgi:hypothetical protein
MDEFPLLRKADSKLQKADIARLSHQPDWLYDGDRNTSGYYYGGMPSLVGAAVSGIAIANTKSAITAAAPDVRKAAE